MVDRKKLDEIILKNNTLDWWRPELFQKNTRHLLPPELEILANPPEEENNYNCFLFVLGLHKNTEVLRKTGGFIYDSFVKHLLDIEALQKTDSPINGDFIVYQDLENYPDNLTHIGSLDNGKVISKWAWGPLIRHSLWDIPSEYGNDYFYIKAISHAKALELFEAHNKHNTKPVETIPNL